MCHNSTRMPLRCRRNERVESLNTSGSVRAGIVQGTAEVASVRCRPQFSSLDISFPPGAADGVRVGASVAVNGTCLTVGHPGQIEVKIMARIRA